MALVMALFHNHACYAVLLYIRWDRCRPRTRRGISVPSNATDGNRTTSSSDTSQNTTANDQQQTTTVDDSITVDALHQELDNEIDDSQDLNAESASNDVDDAAGQDHSSPESAPVMKSSYPHFGEGEIEGLDDDSFEAQFDAVAQHQPRTQCNLLLKAVQSLAGGWTEPENDSHVGTAVNLLLKALQSLAGGWGQQQTDTTDDNNQQNNPTNDSVPRDVRAPRRFSLFDDSEDVAGLEFYSPEFPSFIENTFPDFGEGEIEGLDDDSFEAQFDAVAQHQPRTQCNLLLKAVQSLAGGWTEPETESIEARAQ